MKKKGVVKKGRKEKDFSKKKILAAIKDSGGITSNIADKLHCEWHTANKYVNRYAETKLAFNNECESLLDNAENVLYNLVAGGDFSAVKFLLSTKGKKRGYVEKSELETSQNIVVTKGISIEDWIKEKIK
jgi:hypothetical protein